MPRFALWTFAAPVAAAAGLLLASCQAPSQPVTGRPLPLTRFTSDPWAFTHFSSLDAPGTRVVRDRADWSQLWSEIQGADSPAELLPPVDFDEEMVVAVALGARSSSGHEVVLLQALEEGGGVRVLARETIPGPDCFVATVITQPVDIARLPARATPVDFEVTQAFRGCGP